MTPMSLDIIRVQSVFHQSQRSLSPVSSRDHLTINESRPLVSFRSSHWTRLHSTDGRKSPKRIASILPSQLMTVPDTFPLSSRTLSVLRPALVRLTLYSLSEK